MSDDQPQDANALPPSVTGWIARRTPRADTLVAGCADPMLALELARAGARVTAIDSSEDAIARARHAAGKAAVTVRVQHVEASEWPFEAASFDAVVFDRLLEHQLRPERALGEARRVLRLEGTLIICARYGLRAHGDHADALYLGRIAELLDGTFVVDAIDLLDDVVVVSARPGEGRTDPATLLSIAERRLGELDGSAYRLEREVEAQRARADRLEAAVRTMRASRGWQIARALREGSRSPAKLPRLLSDAFKRKN